MTVTLDAPLLPCLGHHDLYDTVLHSSANANRDRVRSARREATRICRSCPQKCEQLVTPPPPIRKPPTAAPVKPAPADTDDADAVQVVLDGHLPPRTLTAEERQYVVLLLHAQGLIDRQIAGRLGLGLTTVWTIRTGLGLPAHAHHA